MRNKLIATACAVTLDFVETQGNATRAEISEYLQLYPEFNDLTLCEILCALIENRALTYTVNFSGTYYHKPGLYGFETTLT